MKNIFNKLFGKNKPDLQTVDWVGVFLVCGNCHTHVDTWNSANDPSILKCCNNPNFIEKIIKPVKRTLPTKVIQDAHWMTVTRTST